MSDMELPPVNEWIADELARKTDAYDALLAQYNGIWSQLMELMQKYEVTLNTYASLCQRADKMRAAGDALVNFLGETPVTAGSTKIDTLIHDWGEANV